MQVDVHGDVVPFDIFLVCLGARDQLVQQGDIYSLDEKDRDELVVTVAEKKEVKDLAEKYAQAKGETQYYGPFCDLANLILSNFEESNIVFTRNDPYQLVGACNSRRKPDVIAISSSHPDVANDKWKDYHGRGPYVIPSEPGPRGGFPKPRCVATWTWKEIQFLVEFKKEDSTTEDSEAGKHDQLSQAPGSMDDGDMLIITSSTSGIMRAIFYTSSMSKAKAKRKWKEESDDVENTESKKQRLKKRILERAAKIQSITMVVMLSTSSQPSLDDVTSLNFL